MYFQESDGLRAPPVVVVSGHSARADRAFQRGCETPQQLTTASNPVPPRNSPDTPPEGTNAYRPPVPPCVRISPQSQRAMQQSLTGEAAELLLPDDHGAAVRGRVHQTAPEGATGATRPKSTKDAPDPATEVGANLLHRQDLLRDQDNTLRGRVSLTGVLNRT